ncbi:MAG: tRNA (adenosine(37)-N6)-threonylcarbamoyltransferase complex transferase subunit TsaD [Oscillospiraceae bacterium]|nr:tRNA (adenosine(37)-N6)-threonylcarbamoyltransferase complex transferase subunit TsaD [Oscillospiraceae bacterium]
MNILAIETSCDETSCAVVQDGITVLSNIVASQIEEHKLYGGVVPEIASRRHCEAIAAVYEEALIQAKVHLADIDAIAVTYAPGLIGALLVGVNFAKGLALSCGKPLIPVHHIKGHIASGYLCHSALKPPYLALVASGGHTTITRVKGYTEFEVIGRTLDDAAGEAFDKAARAMGLPYPGGVHIAALAKGGDPKKYKLPFPKTENIYDFSFSGLKTAIINMLHNAKQSGNSESIDLPSLAASFQHTVCKILADKLLNCHSEIGNCDLSVSGGVSANMCLREMLPNAYFPALEYCGDNAAMIGCQAYYEFLAGNTADGALNAYATMRL